MDTPGPPPPLPPLRTIEKSFWPQRPEGPRASASMLLVLLGYGIAFDLAFNGQLPGISFPLFVAALVVGIRLVAPRDVTTNALLGSALVLSIFPAIRAADGLIVVDVAAVGTLLALAVLRPAEVLDATVLAFVRSALFFARGVYGTFGFIGAPLGGAARRVVTDRWRPGVRAAAIAVPIVAFFTLLLASADPVFADVVMPSLPDWRIGPTVGHIALTCFGMFAVGVVWRAALVSERIPAGDDAGERRRLGFTEWATALAALDVLFLIFVVVQFAFLFGGRARVEVTEGLTYAEYARSGFTQLIVVGGLVVGLVLAAWDYGSRSTQREERTFRWLAGTMVGLCGVILASALQRLALYEDAFGFTARRFAGYAIIVFIAAVLVILLWALLADARRRVTAAVLAAGLLVVVAVNVVNPVRFIADQNARRYRATQKIDAFYLATLGPDAVPAITRLLPSLKGTEAEVIRAWLCIQAETRENDPGWRSWNGARTAAWAAVDRIPLSPSACARALDAPLPFG